MTPRPRTTVLEQLGRALRAPERAGQPDDALLRGFLQDRDEAAFAALVRRHGPMVLGVCRRVLRNHADAEDAFQATFLVLVRKASAIARREQVGPWLYTVAYHTALKARARAARRRAEERQVAAMAQAETPDQAREAWWQQLQTLLDHELSALPAKYRTAVVLCELEGRTRKEVARQLGLAEGTVASRLARGRELLARRMSKHGLTVPAGVLAAALAPAATAAPVSPALAQSTLAAASAYAAGASLAAVPAAVLAEGVLKAMLLTKIKSSLAVVLLVGVAGVGAGGWGYHALAAGEPGDPVAPTGAPPPATRAHATGDPVAPPRPQPPATAPATRAPTGEGGVADEHGALADRLKKVLDQEAALKAQIDRLKAGKTTARDVALARENERMRKEIEAAQKRVEALQAELQRMSNTGGAGDPFAANPRTTLERAAKLFLEGRGDKDAERKLVEDLEKALKAYRDANRTGGTGIGPPK